MRYFEYGFLLLGALAQGCGSASSLPSGTPAEDPTPQPGATPAPPGFTVVSYNILHGLGDEDPGTQPWDRFEERIALITKILAQEKPDIIALQEVVLAPALYPNFVEELQSALKTATGKTYVAYFGDVSGKSIAVDSGSGIGELTLTHFPVVKSENFHLTQIDLFDPRNVVFTRITTPRGPVDVFNAHLEGSEDNALAHQEMSEVVALLDEDKAVQTFLMGDLNSPGSRDVYDHLRNAGLSDLSKGAGLECTPERMDGCTCCNIPLDRKRNRANEQLDFIWSRTPEGKSMQVDFRNIFNAAHENADGSYLWLSDHIGQIARIK